MTAPTPRILGIDLGTTNSAVAVASEDEPARAVPIAQVVASGEVAERPTLPSFLLLPNEHEVAPARCSCRGRGRCATDRHVRARSRRGAAGIR